MTSAMLALLAKAAAAPDGSVLARGFIVSPGVALWKPWNATGSCRALVRRGFLVERAARVFRITAEGRAALQLEGYAHEVRKTTLDKPDPSA